MAWKLETPPATEPLALSEAKNFVKQDGIETDDALLSGLIVEARQHVETALWRQLVTATWLLTRDGFPTRHGLPYGSRNRLLLELRLCPVQNVEIKYYDAEGQLQTLDPSSYQLDNVSEPGRLRPIDAWPPTDRRLNAVEVRVTAGYGNAAAVPDGIKQYMLARINHLYMNRGDKEAKVPAYFEGQLDPFRWRSPVIAGVS